MPTLRAHDDARGAKGLAVGVRGLTEGAILATLVALLALATRYLPVIQIVSAFVCPLPLTFLVIRQGLRVAVLAALVATGVGVIAGGPLTGVAIAATFAPLGIVLGLGVRQRWKPVTIISASTAVATASVLINLALTLIIAGVNPYTVMIESMQQGQEQSLRLYERFGVDPKQFEQASKMMKQALEFLPKLVPLLIVGGGAFLALINFHVGRLVLRRFGIVTEALPPLTTWRIHPFLLWLLPVGFMLMLIGSALHEAVETGGLNLFVLAQMLLSFQGLLVAWSFFDRYHSPNWLRWIMIVIAFTQPILSIAFFLLGIADAGFDLRGRWRLAREARS